MKTKIILAATLILLFDGSLKAQYYGERVLEKSFEQSDLFFRTNEIIPYGLSSFKNVAPGLVDDPILNLKINPANLYYDSSGGIYIYADLRSISEIKEPVHYYPIIAYADYRSVSFYYPFYYTQQRKEIEPVLSGAILTRPFMKSLPKLFIGLSYQAIYLSEKYYSIPTDIYKSFVGYDYTGAKVASDVADIPITDKYMGQDNMHTSANTITLYSGYDLSDNFKVGIKLNRTLFSKSGAYGNKNFWESTYYSNSSSNYNYLESRSQDYSHWDAAGGVSYEVDENSTIGAMIGCLSGRAKQDMNAEHSSLYRSGTIGTGSNWSYYEQNGTSTENWDHDGRTFYAGVNFSNVISENKTLRFYYSFSRSNIDIALNSTIYDTSYSGSRWTYDTTFSSYLSDYSFSDIRSGSGTKHETAHRGMVALNWKISEKATVDIGFYVEIRDGSTNTDEHVLNDSHSYYNYTSNSYQSTHFDTTRADKHLLWDFSTSYSSLQIPVFLNWIVSDAVSLLFGINRNISNWEISDVTTAIFKYRFNSNPSGSSLTTNFGERYTQPTEKVSDVKTSVMLGVTISPSPLLRISLLASPQWADTYTGTELQDVRWWINFVLKP